MATLQQVKQKESEATIHAEWLRSEQKQKESDAKWATWMKQLQDEQGKKQKEASDDYVWRITELDQQCVQQDERYIKLQQRLHVSKTSVQSTALYQCHGNPLVSVHALPPPLSVSQQLLPALSPCMPAQAPQVSQLRGGTVCAAAASSVDSSKRAAASVSGGFCATMYDCTNSGDQTRKRSGQIRTSCER